MEKRYVKWYKYEIPSGECKYKKVLKGEAIFHAWGVDHAEFETGPGNFSTAIIELPDGTVKNIPVENIEFK